MQLAAFGAAKLDPEGRGVVAHGTHYFVVLVHSTVEEKRGLPRRNTISRGEVGAGLQGLNLGAPFSRLRWDGRFKERSHLCEEETAGRNKHAVLYPRQQIRKVVWKRMHLGRFGSPAPPLFDLTRRREPLEALERGRGSLLREAR